jgi:hypothetical protein
MDAMYVAPALFLIAILALLAPRVQRVLQNVLKQSPALLFAIPALLSAVFLAAAVQLRAFNFPLAGLILAYTFLPVIFACLARRTAPPVTLDFFVIALLWFPLEFSVGQQWAPRSARSTLHLTAYGVSIWLGLAIFLLFRRLAGMKYSLPRSARDLRNLLLGFAASAPILRTRHRFPAAFSPARPVRAAHRVGVSHHPGRYRATRGDPVPRPDPKLHRAEIRRERQNAAHRRVHFRLRASG